MSRTMSRRDFVKAGSAAAALLTGCAPGDALGKQDAPTLKIGLVGCGGRGTGAAENCMNSAPNVQLVAMGDMFPDRLKTSRRQLSVIDGYKVQDNAVFTGFDAYKKVIDSGVDMVLFATPPGFRPMHVEAAIDAGKHVFMEKPVAVDPVGVRKIIEAGRKAKAKKLGILAGTQYRHQASFMATISEIHNGRIGRIRGGRAYYNTGGLWVRKRLKGWSDMEWQLRNWYYFDWLSGDHILEQHIHTIDVTDWVMNGHPVKATAVGGRTVRTQELYGNIFDHFAVDYEYPGGVHVHSMARQWAQTSGHIGAYFAGQKGDANVYRGEITGDSPWKYPDEISIAKAYVQEHTDLIESIRRGDPINEAEQVGESTLTAIMGREAAYTGKTIERAQIMDSKLDLSPAEYKFGENPVRPVPVPGKTEREL